VHAAEKDCAKQIGNVLLITEPINTFRRQSWGPYLRPPYFPKVMTVLVTERVMKRCCSAVCTCLIYSQVVCKLVLPADAVQRA